MRRVIIIIIIIMKSSFDRDNNYCHYVIQRIAGFAITLYYHPAGISLFKYLCRRVNNAVVSTYTKKHGGLAWAIARSFVIGMSLNRTII
jgi:hypothetical protein